MLKLSNFPNEIDTFNVLSDITIDDIENKKEYKSLMDMNSIQRENYPLTHNGKSWQERIDELVVLLEGKILMSSDITKLQDAILNMQEYILVKEVHVSTQAPINPPTNKLWIDTN